MDAHAILSERKDASVQFEPQLEYNNLEEISLAGKTISGWLNELEIIAREVEAELVSRDIGCHLVEVLEAVNVVLFESRGFKRFPVLVDSKLSYLHKVVSSGRGSGKLLAFLVHLSVVIVLLTGALSSLLMLKFFGMWLSTYTMQFYLHFVDSYYA